MNDAQATPHWARPSTSANTRRTLVFFAALALALLFAGTMMCGPMGVLTSSSAGDQTSPVSFQIANGTGGNDIPASAAGADPSRSRGGGNLDLEEENHQQEGACPACEFMFGKLAGKTQHVELQLRGVSRANADIIRS